VRGPWLTLALGAAAATLVGVAAVAVLRSPALPRAGGARFQRLEGDGGREGDLEAELTPLSRAPNSADEPRAAAPQGAASRGGALAAVSTSVL
jgi:hypothetical protein